MADSDEASLSQRDSHFNQQRSSLRSDRSIRTPSRPQSSQLIQDYLLDPSEEPSPSPVIPTRRQSLEKGKRRNSKSSAGRRGIGSRSGSRGGNIDEYLGSNAPGSRNAFATSPVDNWHDRTFYRHSVLEEERTESRASRTSRISRASRLAHFSRRSSVKNSPLSRRGTPATDFGDITALPVIDDAAAGPRPDPQKYADDYAAMKRTPRKRRASRLATELYTISYLIFFAILGTLARLGLQWLTFYPGAPVIFSELWANVGGTLVMGFLAEDRQLFRREWGKETSGAVGRELRGEEEALEGAAAKASHAKIKKTIPLYIGLATGFCGSFTSFSSFMRDIFFALSNDLPSPLNRSSPSGSPLPNSSSTVSRNGGYTFMAVVAVILITIALCYCAYKIGAHIANYTDRITPTLPFRFSRRVLDPVFVLLGWGLWIGAIIMTIFPPDRPSGPQSKGSWDNETWRGEALFACVFAPAGCLLRFYISLKLNTISPSFPLGTFVVNIFGTAVLGMAYDLQHVRISGSGVGVGGGRVTCQVLQGIMDGFCGALTTVSTWIAEIHGLKRGSAYIYGICSVLVGLGTLVCIMGSVRWTVGFSAAVCVT